jgi:hypothetical protein
VLFAAGKARPLPEDGVVVFPLLLSEAARLLPLLLLLVF